MTIISSIIDDRLRAAGFQDNARLIITERLECLATHAAMWSADDPRWHQVFFADNTTLRRELIQFAAHAARVEMSPVWRSRLSQLARDFGLMSDIEHSVFVHCHSNGWFDVCDSRKQRHRPKIKDIEEQFLALRRESRSAESLAHALAAAALCRDLRVARLVAQEFLGPRVERKAVNRAAAILDAWGQYSDLGLLHLSSYPFYEELRLIEEYVQDIPQEHRPADSVLAQVRADVVAVGVGLHKFDYKGCTLYRRHIWTEPPGSDNRVRYTKQFLRRLRARICAAIATARWCTVADAEHLFKLYCDTGLAGIIDWHAGKSGGKARQSVEFTRVLAAVQEVTVGIEPMIRAEIVRLTEALLLALHIVGISFSRMPLIKDYPSSRRRISWGRRLSFGVASIMRRRHERRRQRPEQRILLSPSTQSRPSQPSLERDLIAEFARIALLTEQDAANRLRNVISYGVLGFVPRSHWYQLFEPRLVTWLRLIRLGHPEHSVEWSRVYAVASMYATELNRASPSSQVLKTIFKSMVKPPYWHGGKGIMVVGVHQRRPRVITEQPQLHAAWFIIWISIKLALVGESGVVDEGHLLLVIDDETELPVGSWMSDTQPGSREVGLAFYQAIWHPGVLDWPLRGIPRRLLVPKRLLADGEENLKRAASYLLTDIQKTERSSLEGKKRAQKLVADIRGDGLAEARGAAGLEPLPVDRALQILLEWIQRRTFPNHRQTKPPLSIREQLVAMPGHDLPAAGWLLPRVGACESSGDGFVYNEQQYESRSLHIPAGQQLPVRAFPFFYPSDELLDTRSGIFVEVNDGAGSTRLHYVTRQPGVQWD